VAFDGFADILLGFFEGCTRGDAAWEVRNIGGPVGLGLLEDYCVFQAHFFCSSPAAFKIDFSVPTGTSSPGLPGIVTTYGFEPRL